MRAVVATWPASPESIAKVMALDASPHHLPPHGDGRSALTWIRTLDGDLILGIFPYGDAFVDADEGCAETDYRRAAAAGEVR